MGGAAATVGGIVEGGLKYFTNAPNDPTMPYFSGNLFYQVATDYSNSFIWPFVDKKLLNR